MGACTHLIVGRCDDNFFILCVQTPVHLSILIAGLCTTGKVLSALAVEEERELRISKEENASKNSFDFPSSRFLLHSPV